MTETRLCLVSCEDMVIDKTSSGEYHNVTIEKKAVFHRFADELISDDNRSFPITRAIVEFEDGQVEMVDPNKIKFIK